MNEIIVLDKFPAKLDGQDVRYFMPIGGEMIALHEWIHRHVRLEFTGRLQCMDCKKIVKKFYAPGLCYVCMQSSALNSECIINPEKCEAHLGKGKVPEWEALHHNQPHIVYLANSGGLKVGVTRSDQIPTRWIDQGADEAIILARTPYRQLAGQIEVALKTHLSDKTNWRIMLKNKKDSSIDMLAEKQKYASLLYDIQSEYGDYISEDDTVYSLHYPYPALDQTITSLKLDKQPVIEGILTGIKAQYLLFDHKNVINIRSHGGYEVAISVDS